ncbi:MAG: toast rack family protein [Planctomycetota bacterium]
MRRALLLLVVALSTLPACGRPGEAGPMISSQDLLEREGCASLEVRIDMPGGQLNVSPGQEYLVDARFKFDKEAMRPLLESERDGDRVLVTVSAPGYEDGIGRTFNEWDLRLLDACPIDLALSMRIGRAELNLAGVKARSLDLNLGGGELILDLGEGSPLVGLTGNVEVGHGKALLKLPAGAGIRVRAWKSVGSLVVTGLSPDPEVEDAWVNPSFGRSEVIIDLTVRVGMGDLEVIARE